MVGSTHPLNRTLRWALGCAALLSGCPESTTNTSPSLQVDSPSIVRPDDRPAEPPQPSEPSAQPETAGAPGTPRTPSPNDRCTRSPEELTGVVVTGSFAHDRGCVFASVRVGGSEYDDRRAAANAALAASDWAEATADRREELARVVVSEVLFAHERRSNTRVETLDDGSVAVHVTITERRRSHRAHQPPPASHERTRVVSAAGVIAG